MADAECINPRGSSRANHRQEQTALNAIFCALDFRAARAFAAAARDDGGGDGGPLEATPMMKLAEQAGGDGGGPAAAGTGGGGAVMVKREATHSYKMCTSARAFRMTSDFENDGDVARPTADETDWNGLSIFTRRGHPIKPYVRFLQLRAAVPRSRPHGDDGDGGAGGGVEETDDTNASATSPTGTTCEVSESE